MSETSLKRQRVALGGSWKKGINMNKTLGKGTKRQRRVPNTAPVVRTAEGDSLDGFSLEERFGPDEHISDLSQLPVPGPFKTGKSMSQVSEESRDAYERAFSSEFSTRPMAIAQATFHERVQMDFISHAEALRNKCKDLAGKGMRSPIAVHLGEGTVERLRQRNRKSLKHFLNKAVKLLNQYSGTTVVAGSSGEGDGTSTYAESVVSAASAGTAEDGSFQRTMRDFTSSLQTPEAVVQDATITVDNVLITMIETILVDNFMREGEGAKETMKSLSASETAPEYIKTVWRTIDPKLGEVRDKVKYVVANAKRRFESLVKLNTPFYELVKMVINNTSYTDIEYEPVQKEHFKSPFTCTFTGRTFLPDDKYDIDLPIVVMRRYQGENVVMEQWMDKAVEMLCNSLTTIMGMQTRIVEDLKRSYVNYAHRENERRCQEAVLKAGAVDPNEVVPDDEDTRRVNKELFSSTYSSLPQRFRRFYKNVTEAVPNATFEEVPVSNEHMLQWYLTPDNQVADKILKRVTNEINMQSTVLTLICRRLTDEALIQKSINAGV